MLSGHFDRYDPRKIKDVTVENRQAFIRHIKSRNAEVTKKVKSAIGERAEKILEALETDPSGISFQDYTALLRLAERAEYFYGAEVLEATARIQEAAKIAFESGQPSNEIPNRALFQAEASKPFAHEGSRGSELGAKGSVYFWGTCPKGRRYRR